MTELFLKIINMSISAGWLVLAVVILRFFLKKAPKWSIVTLWGIVAARLLFPFSIESALSLIPSAQTIDPETIMRASPTIQSGIPVINNTLNPIISEIFAPQPLSSANPLQILIPIFAVVWVLGIALLLGYTVISCLRLRSRVCTSVRLRDNIYQSERIASPFVFGVIKPKIYLPFSMKGEAAELVIAHETAHIRRRDHLWKPFGFLLLTVYWFNPLMWIAYILLCRDIELACDEKVIKELGSEQRVEYSQALLECSVNRRAIAACPIAFGEVGVKERVKAVLNYKKPAFWIIIASIIICIVVGVCFLTDPIKQPENSIDKPLTEVSEQNYPKERAIEDGCVVIEENTLIAGEKRWIDFVNATSSGRPAAVKVYQTNGSWRNTEVEELTFDGEKYSLRYYDYDVESGKTVLIEKEYNYLIHDTTYSTDLHLDDSYYLADFSAMGSSVMWSTGDVYSNSHLVYSVVIDLSENYEYGLETAYGIAFADIDKDGKEEKCYLGAGRTSGVFTFTLSAYEDDELEYNNTYLSEFYYLSFLQDENGKLKIRGISQGNDPKTHLFDIVLVNGNLELKENGEVLASATNNWNQE